MTSTPFKLPPATPWCTKTNTGSKDQRQRVTSCTDTAQLDLWFDRAITAGTAAEVFAD